MINHLNQRENVFRPSTVFGFYVHPRSFSLLVFIQEFFSLGSNLLFEVENEVHKSCSLEIYYQVKITSLIEFLTSKVCLIDAVSTPIQVVFPVSFSVSYKPWREMCFQNCSVKLLRSHVLISYVLKNSQVLVSLYSREDANLLCIVDLRAVAKHFSVNNWCRPKKLSV